MSKFLLLFLFLVSISCSLRGIDVSYHNGEIDFSKVKVVVYREFRNGKLANCRPCPACMAAIKEMGIEQIYYTTEDGGYVKEEIKSET